jgi:CHASE3 domain sensor protein
VRAYIVAAFTATTLVVVALVFFQWRAFRGVEVTDALVRHTLAVERDLTALGNDIVDAERGQRGFLLTGLPAYLAPYRRASADVPIEIARLKGLVIQDPARQARIAKLDTLSEAKLAELNETIKLANEGDRDSALEIVRTNVGDSLMTSIRFTLRDAIRVEDSLRSAREYALETAFAKRDSIAAGLAVLLGAMLATLAYILRRMQRYRDLVTLCAWSKAVNYQGEWMSFEEYLKRRFGLAATHGISPEALKQLENDMESNPA